MTAVLEIAGYARASATCGTRGDRPLDPERGVHAIIGPNGAGKTTLFNCMCGESRANAGTVTLDGRDITRPRGRPRVRLGLARTFQLNRVFESMSAAENVELALQKTRLRSRLGSDAAALSAARSSSAAVNCSTRSDLAAALQDRIAGEISHADRRAVEVAMALACDPIVLCLDEPTAGIGIGEAERLAVLIGNWHSGSRSCSSSIA